MTRSHVEPVSWRQVCETPNGEHAARVVVWTNAEHLVHDRMPRMPIPDRHSEDLFVGVRVEGF